MEWSRVERCRELARLVGIPIAAAEMAEVAERLESRRWSWNVGKP